MSHWLLSLLLVFALLPSFAQDTAVEDDWEDDWEEEGDDSLPFTGFLELGLGTRLQSDPAVDKDATLEELRWRAETDWENDALSLVFKGDVLLDGVEETASLDIRDASIAFSPGAAVDMKIGRQVLTWGTGDLVFLNDLFPKDWVSLFAGRDDEYLKSPSNSLRFLQYNKVMNIDFVWTPVFTPDEFIRGDRFSWFSPIDGEIIADEPPVDYEDPSRTFENGEFALRLFRSYQGAE